jgi:hypothetical protein
VRYLLIIGLVIATVWALIERNQLKDDVAALQKQVAERDADIEAYKRALPGGQTVAQPNGTRSVVRPNGAKGGNWLDAHIEKGAKALESPHIGDRERR